ncbi:OLC1v1000728C1 [Oldenlandia corymbosa var. corymbosa]|uniref:OLC1v1000728C1 n=1 Tax=Oldenlandia corymbosa var. corymbosa TaxID=529605 RepID=A0AAV1D4G5_OLDCO|nr:OLC1v1000728C1 [Oldenlandia corymbosa var. corymbosa]
MGGTGNWIADYRELDMMTTVVLLGCRGSGKSGTGNSLVGRKAFETDFSKHATVCQRQATVVQDAQVLHVIDTPGGFLEPGFKKEEICRCLDMARFGIHAILFVVSLQRGFGKEVEGVEALKHYFGPRIVDYIIFVFTVGDELDDKKEVLDDWLARTCPSDFKEFIVKCGNRRIVVENQAKDALKKAAQLENLLILVSETVAINGGKPYTEFLVHQKANHGRLDHQNDEMVNKLKEQLKSIQGEHERGQDEICKLKQELAKVLMEASQNLKDDFLRVTKREEEAQDEIRKLREKLERAQMEVIERFKEDLRRAQSQV